MNIWKKILAAGMSLALCFAVAACSMVEVNQERDRAQVVADVNGTAITKGEVDDTTNSMLYAYGMTEDTYVQQYGSDQLVSMKENVLNELITQEVYYQHAKQEGLVDDSDEHKAEVKAEIEQAAEGLKDTIRTTVESDATVADADKEKEIASRTEQFLTSYGYDDIDALVDRQIRTDGITAMQDKLNNEVTYSEDDAKTYYDQLVEDQQSKVEEDAANYKTFASSSVAVVRPADSKYVKNLLLQIPEDVQKEIQQLRTDGDDAGADVKRDEALAGIKAAADAALARAKAGEDFDALIEELGEDTGMTQEPAKTEGYLVYKGSGMVQSFEDAALALANPGDISDLVASDYGYHIIKNVRNAGGVIPFDEIKDDIMKNQLSALQSTHRDETLTEWKDGENITVHTDRLS